MRPLARIFLAALAALAVAVLAPRVVAAGTDGADGLDRRVVFEVVYEAGEGNEAFRSEVERRIAAEMERNGCFGSLALKDDRPAEARELLLQVVIGYIDDESEYGYSLAQLYDRNLPPVDQRDRQTRFEVEIGMNLFERQSEALERFERRRIVTSHRTIVREDARAVSREEMLDAIARRVRLWACRPSATKLEKLIRRAVGDA